MELESRISWNNERYHVDWNQVHSLGIPFRDGWPQVNCFGAPPFRIEAVRSGDFVGDTREGSPVNFKNVFINPHGNGTHTECVGHISKQRYSIHHALQRFHYLCRLVSLEPIHQEDGDHVLKRTQFEALEGPWPEALALRTLPNPKDKKKRVYSGKNPPYLKADAMQWMVEQGIEHVLVDLPSVDPEEDGGALLAHKSFWQYPDSIRTEATISELIFVENELRDGLYLLNIQVPPFVLDAAPSRPVLYPLIKE